MSGGDMTGAILEHVRVGPLKNPGRAAAKTGSMFAQLIAPSAGLDTNQPDFLVFDEVVEDADGIGSAADTGNDCGGQLALGLEDLRTASRPMTRWKSRTMVG